MGLTEILLIAIALSMDAFAVSISLGLSVKKPKIKQLLIPAINFGFFQALMPLIGYLAGINFVSQIQNLDHWIAFALLVLIGGKMIKESFSNEEKKVKDNPFRFLKMLLLAVATSIDALAVGITFAFFEVNIFTTILIIGFTTFCISAIGLKIANVFGTKYKSKAEFIGGVVLIVLGFKILIEHLITH
jgi:putative Mn2+ efflux pump MntP